MISYVFQYAIRESCLFVNKEKRVYYLILWYIFNKINVMYMITLKTALIIQPIVLCFNERVVILSIVISLIKELVILPSVICLNKEQLKYILLAFQTWRLSVTGNLWPGLVVLHGVLWWAAVCSSTPTFYLVGVVWHILATYTPFNLKYL